MSRESSDVSAVVLTIGEPTTQRALDSLTRQTLRPAEVVIVKDVRPIHKAINEGAARVTTPFFVQVDSDMVLDPDCIEQLRKRMRPKMGEVVGMLRDPLMGQVMGVKLYRTECFRQVSMPDSITPDTDHYQLIRARGWKGTLARRGLRTRLNEVLALGEHSPSYTPDYTYHKYLLEGRRYHYRQSHLGIRWHFAKLERSTHRSALIAQIGLAHGVFLDSSEDLLGRKDVLGDHFIDLERFFDNSLEAASAVTTRPAAKVSAELYSSYFKLGRSLFEERKPRALEEVVRALGGTRGDDAAWIAKIALFRGIIGCESESHGHKSDFAVLQEFLAMTDPESPTLLRWIGRFNQRMRRLRAEQRRLSRLS
jgi:glycosyltransferase involved in cell wall biosynthesis